jgi:exoribonuclease R
MSQRRVRISDAGRVALQRGLVAIRREHQVPDGFPAAVLEAAERAATRRPTVATHVDRTDLGFVTLDPATSTDLDQAFVLERAGGELLLRYAIADVGWFVDAGSPLDTEAFRRGLTRYLPDGRAGLYPPVLSERAASLLPDGPRPAVVFVIRLGDDGVPHLDGVERAMVHSRAKLAYDAVTLDDLPAELGQWSERMLRGDAERGAARVDPPEQEIDADGEGGYRLSFRPRLVTEAVNASMSLATNLAVGTALFAARTGLFRVMDEPDERAVRRLRHTARAMGIRWAESESLAEAERRLDASSARDAAFMLAVRRAGGAARYEPYRDGVVPWHAAMAATYSHATAPLRRLQDRHVVLAALAVANGHAVPDDVAEAFAVLPEVMAEADREANRIDRAVLDLVEAATLLGHEGQVFEAVVTDVDDRGARFQIADPAVVARVDARRVQPGDAIQVKLESADPVARRIEFVRTR